MKENTRLFRYDGRDVLALPADRDEFATLLNWLGDIARALNMSDGVRKQLMVAADEIFTNIAMHGYPEEEGTMEISVKFDETDRCLALTFTDSGIPFDPLEATEPDLDRPPEEREIGGLGIFLVRRFMDSVEYRRENDRNVLVLRKMIPTADGSHEKR